MNNKKWIIIYAASMREDIKNGLNRIGYHEAMKYCGLDKRVFTHSISSYNFTFNISNEENEEGLGLITIDTFNKIRKRLYDAFGIFLDLRTYFKSDYKKTPKPSLTSSTLNPSGNSVHTKELHYVKPPKNTIVIDLDIPGESGKYKLTRLEVNYILEDEHGLEHVFSIVSKKGNK